MHLDTEQAHRGAIEHSLGGRIQRIGQCANIECRGRGRAHEAWLAFEKGCPGIAFEVHAAQYDEGQLGVEVAMLVGHEIPDDTLADTFHPLGDADFFLDEFLAFMPDRQLLQVLGHVRVSGDVER
mgnify:CR=1 FL=1